MRAATEGHLPPVMPQGNLVEVLGCEMRQGSPGELMVESSPSGQRRPPCKTRKKMSDDAADAAALTYYLLTYERGVFSEEVRLSPGQEHPKAPGTERLGFAKFDLYPNAKPKSVKPIRLVGERAAAEQEIVEDVLPRGWIEPCPASEWASKGFVVPK